MSSQINRSDSGCPFCGFAVGQRLCLNGPIWCGSPCGLLTSTKNLRVVYLGFSDDGKKHCFKLMDHKCPSCKREGKQMKLPCKASGLGNLFDVKKPLSNVFVETEDDPFAEWPNPSPGY